MKIRKIYISDDGEEFDNEEACLEHENVISSIDSMVLFNSEGELITGREVYDAYDRATYIYILDEDRARAFLDFVLRELRYPIPKEPETGVLYYFDEQEGEYVDLRHKIEDLTKLLDRLTMMAKNVKIAKEGTDIWKDV